MRVLVFQNYPCEDAATAGLAFEALGHTLRVIDAWGGDPAPDFADGDAALILGGPMNVYEEEKHPFLRWQTEWIRDWVRSERPLLGLCLGAQLIAKATGGRVTRNPEREIGHYEVELTDAGVADPVFRGFDRLFPVTHWHGDTFSIPVGGVRLAQSERCANQALRIGRAVGLQFHLEIGRAKMNEWLKEYAGEIERSEFDPGAILRRFDALESRYSDLCRRLVRNFCETAKP